MRYLFKIMDVNLSVRATDIFRGLHTFLGQIVRRIVHICIFNFAPLLTETLHPFTFLKWLEFGTKTTWLGSGRDVLSQNIKHG